MVRSESHGNRFAHRAELARRVQRLRVLDENEVGRPHRPIRLSNIVQGQLDVRVDPFYDVYIVPVNTAVTKQVLFGIPLNNPYTPPTATTFNKTLYHTNLVQANMLDAPKKMLVKNISIVPRPDMSPADLNALIGQFYVEFDTLNKEYWQGHGQKLPGGAGGFVSGLTSTGMTGTAVLSVANGWPSAQNTAPITDDVPDIPGYAPPPPITGVLLETNQPFNVTLDPTLTAGTIYTTQNSVTTTPGVASIGIYAWCYLEGVKLVAIV